MDRHDFAADRKTVYAVVRALEIISEASRRLPAELEDSHPEIDCVAGCSSRERLPARVRGRGHCPDLAHRAPQLG